MSRYVMSHKSHKPNKSHHVPSSLTMSHQLAWPCHGEGAALRIIATVGYGRHQLRTAAAPSASAGRVFLHEALKNGWKDGKIWKEGYETRIKKGYEGRGKDGKGRCNAAV